MILSKTKLPEHGDVIIKKKFAFLPRTVNETKGTVRIWLRTYYEKREYLALIPGIIEGWEITDWLKDPTVSNLRVIK